MVELLGFVLISFFISSILLIPFIDYLFHLRKKFRNHHGDQEKTSSLNTLKASPVIDVTTPIHNQILKGKDVDTPVGGGLLLIPLLIVLSVVIIFISDRRLNIELLILIITLISFGFVGFLDDIKKISTAFSGKYAGIKGRYIFILQILFAFAISLMLYFLLGFNNIFVPIFGNVVLGFWYIPLAAFAIISFSNAYNISDGLDGLSTGLLTICLFAFLILANSVFDHTLSTFVGLWIGALVAYLYFNVFPARIYLGDAGAYGFGAALAVVGLMTGKILGLGVIGAVYIIIVGSSLIQIFGKRFLKRKIFPVAPIHMYFKYIGWEEPKIVIRFWLAGAIFAILGLWLALLSQ